MRWIFCLAILLSGFSFSQDAVGILSFIEDRILIDPQAMTEASREGIRRVQPFVEVVDISNFQECLAQDFGEDCPQFEWSLNFASRENMETFEEEAVIAWLRFQLRSYYRARLEAGQDVAMVVCNIGHFDLTWYTMTGNLFFPGREFCDGYRGNYILANCFWDCTFAFSSRCPRASRGCERCARSNFNQSLRDDQMQRYYPDYVEDISTAILRNFPSALLWRNPWHEGAAIAPISNTDILPNKLQEVFQEATNEEIIAPSYYFQTGADNLICQPTMSNDLISVLVRTPGYGYNEESPGIPTLEEVKTELSSRESIGDTYTRFGQWFLGKEHLLPKYDENGGNWFFGNDAYDALATPTTYSCFGYSSMYEITSEWETIISPNQLTTVMGGCYNLRPWPTPSVTIAFSAPMTFSGKRAHSALLTIPEGYVIPNVQGHPLY